MLHVHEFEVLADVAIGSFEKRDCPGGEYRCLGQAEVCACGAARFVPGFPGGRTVEIEVEGRVGC